MNQSVLLVDDSPEIHDLLKVRLRSESVTLHHALDGLEALSMARTLMPDLILLDVDMPVMSGFEVCLQLKSDLVTAHVPIIFITGECELQTKVAGFELGATDYVTKPFEPVELRARVRAALRTKRYQDLLATRAQIDALTTLWNRSYFDRRLHDELHAVRRYGRKLSLLLIDLDHFKQINDQHGHPFGDVVLQRVGELLWAELRTADAPCRYGGEELAVILTETNLAGALCTAERLRARIELLRADSRKSVGVTASIGVAAAEQLADPQPATLLGLADDALYSAKRNGRNRICST